ncbi:hypothetical protein AAC03nite_20720 [Alicyclobacillus acidoterrestris]|uniref:biosynthetic peptidoglycan transglycosylase n=1 Tax=Alicyclobacillus suci TaxID=2816080 RepID=UPI0011923E7F|nr:biosynthetic peptidoglycan transglycosylase [Alicyclobacillus suci]GEO26287.1 hypothetical protein AAC03nite_20720 [Alicyclobacillus acidoterrestris]
MFRLMKFIFGLAFFVAVCLGAMNLYFHKVFPIAKKVRVAASTIEVANHVHPLTAAEIPSTFREAIVATEDRRFNHDPGIDLVGIARSIVVDIQKDGYVEGGSTITQQLVDNTLLSKRKTMRRKLKQMFYAVGVYDTMSKREVFTLYTNVIYFGHGAYGLHNAAETYFGRSPAQCNEGELTMLAGLPNAPSAYDPLKNYTLARQRQRLVLENMVDAGYISNAKADEIYQEPLRLA